MILFSRVSHESTTRLLIIELIINHAYKLPISVKRKCHKWRGTATGDHCVSETPPEPTCPPSHPRGRRLTQAHSGGRTETGSICRLGV